jgi:hypothetical protein
MMPWFRCLVRGENYPLQIIGISGPVGFYVTRFVEAANEHEAESAALASVRDDPRLVLDSIASTLVPRVSIEEIDEISQSDVPLQNPGFCWYPMDTE